MEQQHLLIVMAVFTGVAAIALLGQAAALIGVWRATKKLQSRTSEFMDRWEPVADASLETMEQVRKESGELLKQAQGVVATAKGQLDKADATLDEITSNAKTQIERVEQTIESVARRVDATAAEVQRTVLVPLKQIRAFAAALGAVGDALMGRRRSSVDQATLDEEMFI
jgi:gas vesicle protein